MVSHTLLHQMLVSDLVVPVGLAHAPGQEYLTAFGTRLLAEFALSFRRPA